MESLTTKSYKLRRIILEAVYRSSAGHIGGDMSVVDILNVLYNGVMNVSPDRKNDPDRDRFILSKAHCADCLYAVLGEKGYFDVNEFINSFSAYGSRFIGHTNTEIEGVEINGGSLGHGLSVGVGMAIAAKRDKKQYRTYVVLGDGEMAEGSNYEAMMAAAHYKLDNLCATVDLNGLQISGTTEEVMNSASLSEKFRAFGWAVVEVANGNNCEQLMNAYKQAITIKEKPTAIIAHTVKGKGISFMENNVKWHHGVLSKEQYETAVKELEAAING